MEKQISTEHPLDIVPLWMKVLLGVLCSFLAVVALWSHGFKSWDWLIFILLLGIFSFPTVAGPLGRNLRWPLRVLFVLWVILSCAWAAHFWGWVPALAFVCIALLSPSTEKWPGWTTYLQKPYNIIGVLLTLILIIWFARSTGAWVPTVCVVLTFPLLEAHTATRRTLRDNLRRRSFPAIVAITIIAAVWAWLHPSFGNVAGLVLVVVLASCDIYLHTQEDSSPHVPQSQS